MNYKAALKCVVILHILVFGPVSGAAAQTSGAGLLDSSWGKIGYLEAKISVQGTEGFGANEDYRTQIQWKENTKGYFFRKVLSSRFGANEFNVTTAFDGQHYYELNQTFSQALLLTSKMPPTNRDIPNFPLGFFPLDPFAFLHNTVKDTKNTFSGIRDLQSGLLSETLEKAFTSGAVDSNFEGNSAKAIAIPGFEYLIGDPVTYKIFFSKSVPPRLLGWESLRSDNSIAEVLSIKEWKKITSDDKTQVIQYPSAFIERFYQPQKSGPSALSFAYAATVDLQKISTSTSDDEFVVDPGQADYIYDTASKTVVAVPR
jgi:hypothetical protein